jgi:hypothetical protein
MSFATDAAATDRYSYRAGRAGFELPIYRNANIGANEARIAAADWKAAQDDHGHASYWGIAHIRAMRAYWLGALRFYRSGQNPA